MIEEIVLLSGNDIPFPSAQISVHQPKIKEIAYLGEEGFFTGLQLLNFSKELLAEEDKINLADIEDFDILMSIINDESAALQTLSVQLFLLLLFPGCDVSIEINEIHLIKEDNIHIINRENYSEFKEILKQTFSMSLSTKEDYKPKDAAASKIAEKLRKGREKAAKAKGKKTDKVSIFSRYISILAVGLQKDMNLLLDYTVYQLSDEFQRYQMYQNFGINLKARMAGATDLEEVDNWMDDIHP